MAHNEHTAFRLVCLCLLVIGLAPGIATGAPISVYFNWERAYGLFEFGSGRPYAQVVDQVFRDEGSFVEPPFTPSLRIVGGTFNLVTGPLKRVTFEEFPARAQQAEYRYAKGGSVSLTFDIELSDGSISHGTFTAPLGRYTVSADDVDRGNSGFSNGPIGRGLFDDETARLFGITPHTSGGGLWLALDTYDDHRQPLRDAASYGSLVITVPEPTTLSLLGVGIAIIALKRLRGVKGQYRTVSRA